MCSEPTISYFPDYKFFTFIAANGGMKEAEEEKCFRVSDAEKEERNNGSEEYELPELVVFLNDVCFEKKPTLHSRLGKCLIENCELDHKTISSIIESDSAAVTGPCCLKDKIINDQGNGDERIGETNVTEPGEVQKADLALSMVPKDDDASEIRDDITVLEKSAIRVSEESSDSDTATSGVEELLLIPGSHPPDHDPAEAFGLVEDELTKSRGLAESSSQAHQSFSEESSLFVAGHIVGHGPAGPSFRSTSHRSNSSTTSSRSFAFPVIASEWHGSPERMVRTEKRKPRKPERKCARFFCCKFF